MMLPVAHTNTERQITQQSAKNEIKDVEMKEL
jgi:hypothetical protein